jgi:Putative prokaryotic signal transducing protein
MSDHQEHLDRERLVELMVVHHEVEANIIKGLLEAAGVGCVLVTPVPHSLYPFTVDGLARVTVRVLDADLEQARTIIKDHESTRDQELPEPDADA